MPSSDCGFCQQLIECGAILSDQTDFQTIATRLLCEIADCAAEVNIIPMLDVQADCSVVKFFRVVGKCADVITTSDFEVDLQTPYTPTGTVEWGEGVPTEICTADGPCKKVVPVSICGELPDAEILTLCDVQVDGTVVQFLRWYLRTGGIVTIQNTTVDGTTLYTPTGTVQFCDDLPDVETFVLCDDNAATVTPFLRTVSRGRGIVSFANYTLDGTTPYVPTGTVKICDALPDVEYIQLCDDNGAGTITPFLRAISRGRGTSTYTSADYALNGTTPYVVTGTVKRCAALAEQWEEFLCYESGGIYTQFVRVFTKNADTGVVTIENKDAVTGVAIVIPGGAVVGLCPDVCSETGPYTLCRQTTRTGATASSNLTLSGSNTIFSAIITSISLTIPVVGTISYPVNILFADFTKEDLSYVFRRLIFGYNLNLDFVISTFTNTTSISTTSLFSATGVSYSITGTGFTNADSSGSASFNITEKYQRRDYLDCTGVLLFSKYTNPQGAIETNAGIISSLTICEPDMTDFLRESDVRLHSNVVTVAPTVSIAPTYTSGDLVGGKLTFANALRGIARHGTLQSVTLTDESGQLVDLDVVIFGEDPTGTTFTDNAAFTINTADMSKVLGVVHLYDHTGIGAKGISEALALGMNLISSTGTIYAAIIARGAPTYATTTALNLRLGIVQD